ncbi:MAG: hypothetical protein GY754_42390 [bacterium]|nr:hypothetical protein [bacterium]
MKKQDEINLTDVLTLIIQEIVNRSPSFGHIDVSRSLVCVSSNRKGSRGGIYGKLVPLRFENGSGKIKYRGNYFAMPEVIHNNISQLYLIYFYMPKFFDLPPKEQLNVIFHELYHINQDFNGDIRRMGAVKTAHGHSRKHFDSLYSAELESFYRYIKETPYMNFLRLDSRDIYKNFKKITGQRMKIPRPTLIKGAAAKEV